MEFSAIFHQADGIFPKKVYNLLFFWEEECGILIWIMEKYQIFVKRPKISVIH